VPIDFSKPLYALAPLAGWSDLPFRETVKLFGADLTVSEMISANALAFNPRRSERLWKKSPLEAPYAVQLCASDLKILQQAVEVINDQDGVDVIDLNAGCPAPKVVRGGAGSALLKDPALLFSMVSALKKISRKPLLSVKMRLGFGTKNGVALSKACEDAGADFLTVHGRTKSGGFTAPVDYEAIGEIKEKVKIPVIANGDIDSYEKALKVLEITSADGIMIGRAAMGAPWIFAELKERRRSVSAARSAALSHFDACIKFYGNQGVLLFRKHLHRYSRGLDKAAKFRREINNETDVKTVRGMIEEIMGA
jgi:tRNA-dihydrouridine synthase B